MNDRPFLSVFTPSRTPPEILEAILVQRHALLTDAVERVSESATSGNKHHLLFVGPRGTGKTHLVTVLVHRLGLETDLQKDLRIAWLNEDETSTSLLELWQRIHTALAKRYPEEFASAALEPMFDMSPDDAEQWLGRMLLEHLQGRTLLVVVENLDALFEGLGTSGQQKLRAFIQEHPVLALVATAQRLVAAVKHRNSPFFGFFQTEHLQPLSIEQAADLLRKIAALNGQQEVAAFLASARGLSRVRALHHLSGGNHRIYIVLSQFITRDSIDALIGPFSKMVDEMTPYYQERIRWLPSQQRKIVEFLCTRERPIPVKQLARRLFASHQTISSQLKDLRQKGYVQSAQRGRESLYEIAEPMMRICVEVKENQSHEPLQLLVDFLRVWYDGRELGARLTACGGDSRARAYLESALETNEAQGNLRVQLLVEGYRAELGEDGASEWGGRIISYAKESEALALACGEWARGNTDKALSIIAEITDKTSGQPMSAMASAWMLAAEIHSFKGTVESAVKCLDSSLKLSGVPVEQVASALYNRGVAYGKLGDPVKEIADYGAIIGLAEAPVELVAMALNNRGVTYGKLGDPEKAITDYDAVIGLVDTPVEEVAWALNNRGVAYGQLGDPEKEIADYGTVIGLANAPVEDVARTLNNRGATYQQLGDPEKAIADYGTVIGLADASAEEVARAFINRGVAHGKLGDPEKAIADYGAVIGLADTPVEQVAMALNNRGVAHWMLNDVERCEKDLIAVLQLKEAPTKNRVDAHLALVELRIGDRRWDSAMTSLAAAMKEGLKGDSRYSDSSKYIIEAFFDSSLSIKLRRARTRELVRIYRDNDALAQLGEALTEHLGSLHANTDGLPSPDNLESWASAWEEAGEAIDALRLPLRIFRTGIDFLKTGGKDRGILLDLNQEERRLLEQALNLSKFPEGSRLNMDSGGLRNQSSGERHPCSGPALSLLRCREA